MANHEKFRELVGKLEEYCQHENDEHGEFVRGLCVLANYYYCMRNDLTDALLEQMQWEVENYQTHCRIVRTPETYTREYVELEWD